MPKHKNLTINWRGKQDGRGLTELTMETLITVGEKLKNYQMIKDAEILEEKYNALKEVKLFSKAEELETVKEFVRVML